MSTNIEKTRPDDILGNLPEDQQHLILDWCEELSYRDALKRIAAPAPEGLGLTVHYTSLRRFFMKRFPERYLQERTTALAEFSGAASDIAAADFGTYWSLAKESLEKHLFVRLQKDNFDSRDLSTLMRLALRMEDQRLRWARQFNDAERTNNETQRLQLERKAAEREAVYARERAASFDEIMRRSCAQESKTEHV
ncbi:MAG TPA: hypothetical protein VF773_05940 [Verrucomicrobiae bacterium]